MSARYRPEIDGLRAIAVLPVVFFHAGVPAFSGGFVGVDVFFVISGYLISGIIIEQRAQGEFSLARFYERRARRLLPSLLTVIIATCVAAAFIVAPFRLAEIAKSSIAALTFTANIYFWAATDYFATAAKLQPLIHTWTLGIEEQFYILFPLLVIALAGGSRLKLPLVVAVLAVLSLLYSQALTRWDKASAYYLLQSRGWELLAGVLVTLARSRLPPVPGSWTPTAMRVVGLLLIALAVTTYHEAMRLPGLAMLVPVVGAALVLYAPDRGEPVASAMAWRPLVAVGLISYALYLWHQPVLALARLATTDDLSPTLAGALVAACFPLAWATWRFIEQPARDRRRMPLRPFLAAIGSASAATLAFAVLVAGTNGLSFLVRPAYVAVTAQFEREASSRADGIRTDACHLRANRGAPEPFLAQWNCLGEGPGATVLVAGDSHAADKAFALRAAGIEPAQATGAGCSVVPRLMRPECRAFFVMALEKLKGRPGLRVLLAQSVSAGALSPDDIAAAGAFFAAAGHSVLWASPMPAFPRIRDEMAARAQSGDNPLSGAYPFANAAAEASRLAMVDGAGAARVFDTQQAFCAIGQAPCSPYAREDLLLIDPDHLSGAAARAMGPKLAAFLFPPGWQGAGQDGEAGRADGR